MQKWIRMIVVGVVLVGSSLVVVGEAATVDGYWRGNGTYVPPYTRTPPNGNIMDNYGFPGNVNPNTGRVTPGNPWRGLEREYSLPSMPTMPRWDQPRPSRRGW